MLVLWAPYLRTDNQSAAQRATTYLGDSRATHFWDLWRYGSRVYAEQFQYPVTEAWDLYSLYEQGAVWEGKPPPPTNWLQNRQLDHGTPYAPEKLEAELLKLAR